MTVAQAEALLFDWRVPPAVALHAYRRAVRRKFTINHEFTIHMAGVLRGIAEDAHALEVWENEGGANALA